MEEPADLQSICAVGQMASHLERASILIARILED